MERASVNFATSTATVEYDPERARRGDFVGAIEDLGYGVPADPRRRPQADAERPQLRRRLLVARGLRGASVVAGNGARRGRGCNLR